ncbi:MAG: hypothetical protein EOP93_20745 [Lysobacteraceae bacterium]|nr:MAG: hypothetical protein EOP93_20745 [Xanthomonadaceae bacterium]
MKFDIIPVWKQVTPELTEELVAFWKDNNAIAADGIARRRSEQVICVARDEKGEICGVGTAMVRILPRLRQPMYYFRQFFAKRVRGQQHFIPFYQECRRVLEEANAGTKKPEALGLLVEVENSKLSSAYKHAYEPDFEMTFIGYSPRGMPLYVSYFKGVVLLPPSPVRMPAAIPPGARARKRVMPMQPTARQTGRN